MNSSAAAFAVQEIEKLYNEVLQSSVDNCRQMLHHTNNSNLIDKEYFEMLDTADKDNYYSTAYLIFSLIHDDLLKGRQPDEVLLQLLPAEKVSIRRFFSKVRVHLMMYFNFTNQVKWELINNLTRWQSETANSIVEVYLEFPTKLREEAPELQLMDYMAQGKIILDAVAQALQNVLYSILTPRKSLQKLNLRLRSM